MLVPEDTSHSFTTLALIPLRGGSKSIPKKNIKPLAGQPLCAWVLQAERLGLDYGLRLGTVAVGPDQGEAHKRRCLEALARY